MQNLKFDIAPNDIERSHRIGQLKQPGEKQRRVKVNLVLYNHRNMIFRYQKKVKSKKKKKLDSRMPYSKQNGKLGRSTGATWFSQCPDHRW